MSNELINVVKSGNRETNRRINSIEKSIDKSNNLITRILNKINQFFDMIVREFRKSRKTMILMSLWEHIAELESKGILISEQEAIVNDKWESLTEDIDSLDNRFIKINNDTTSNYYNLLNNLDKHIVDITEKYFMGRSANAVKEKSKPFYGLLNQYYTDCESYRRENLEQVAYDTIDSLNDFISSRADFVGNIEDFKIQSKVYNSKAISVPYYQVTKTDKTVKNYLPGDISIDESSIEYKSQKALDRLALNKKNVKCEVISKAEKEELKKSIERIINTYYKSTDKSNMIDDLKKYVDENKISIGRQ